MEAPTHLPLMSLCPELCRSRPCGTRHPLLLFTAMSPGPGIRVDHHNHGWLFWCSYELSTVFTFLNVLKTSKE